MPKYLEKLENFCFSNSSVNSFENCRYQFKLTYLLKRKQSGNFFSDFGQFSHSVLEKYFKDELEIYELLDYYKVHYNENMKNLPPGFMRNADEAYYNSGLEFFKNFSFDKTKYEIILREDYFKGYEKDIYLVIKPDLVLRDLETKDVILYDYKTSEIKKGKKIDQEKLDGYKRQINLYIYFLWQFKNLEINKYRLWFIRSNTFFEGNFDNFEAIETVEHFVDVANKIRKETKFEYNNTNKFFCQNLCGVKNFCKYKDL